jgi:N4-gp56 family major capsid protein
MTTRPKGSLSNRTDILKFSDYNQIVDYVNRGDMRGLVSEKIGQNQVDYLDVLARNAFLTHPNKFFAGGRANRAALTAPDYFDADYCETMRIHLEENEIPGVATTEDGGGQIIVCVTSPRVIKDIRNIAASQWLEVQEYAGTNRKFTSEVGMWAGIRFVKTNRLFLRNAGTAVTQTTLNGATVVGQGSYATVDTVYHPGQSGSTRNVVVTSSAGFAVGQYVTIHAVALGAVRLDTDGTQETRRIVNIADGTHLAFDKPLLKAHLTGDYVTNALNVHASIFMGGPGVVYGVGEAPTVITPPKYDDLMLVNRYGWRGFLKFQLFRPEYFQVVESAGSVD